MTNHEAIVITRTTTVSRTECSLRHCSTASASTTTTQSLHCWAHDPCRWEAAIWLRSYCTKSFYEGLASCKLRAKTLQMTWRSMNSATALKVFMKASEKWICSLMHSQTDEWMRMRQHYMWLGFFVFWPVQWTKWSGYLENHRNG